MLDKAVRVLGVLERGPASLAQLVSATSLPRPTAHRLAVALEHHRLVARDDRGRFVLGERVGELAAASGEDRLLAASGPVLAGLRDASGESAQLYRRTAGGGDGRRGDDDGRVCVATADRPGMGLRDSVPVGAVLTMRAGSAAQVLLAWEPAAAVAAGLDGASFDAASLAAVRRRGWAQSVGEREEGVASVSAPVLAPDGRVVAAVSVSGPLQRLGRQPGRVHAEALLAAAADLGRALAPSSG